MTCPLNELNTTPGASSVTVMKQLDSMIKSNISIIFILLVVLLVLGFGLYFFSKSLFSTLSKYNTQKEMNRTTSSESLKDKAADNEEYIEQEQDDIEPDSFKMVADPSKFMPKPKRDFLKKLDIENREYNKEKTEFVTRKLNYGENDDVVDSKILYKDHDNYTYDYNTE